MNFTERKKKKRRKVNRKAEAPWLAAYDLLPKAIAFGRAMSMLTKPSLWWSLTEIKETRRAKAIRC